MKFVEVNGDHVPRTRKKPLHDYLTEFMNMGVKIVKVDFNEREYKDVRSAQASFYKSVKRFGFSIDITISDGELYLIRRDM